MYGLYTGRVRFRIFARVFVTLRDGEIEKKEMINLKMKMEKSEKLEDEKSWKMEGDFL